MGSDYVMGYHRCPTGDDDLQYEATLALTFLLHILPRLPVSVAETSKPKTFKFPRGRNTSLAKLQALEVSLWTGRREQGAGMRQVGSTAFWEQGIVPSK